MSDTRASPNAAERWLRRKLGRFSRARLLSRDRVKVEDELRARLRQQESVARLGSEALRATDSDGLLSAIVATVSRVLEVEFCKILERQPDGNCLLRAGVGWTPGLVGHAQVSGGLSSQAGFTLLTNEPVLVDDLRTETRFTGPLLLHDHGVTSGLSVVIQGADGPYGVLGAHTRRQRHFSEDDGHYLQSLANIIGDFIKGQKAKEELQQALAFADALLESLPGIACLFDDAGTIRRWNLAFERVLGYGAGEIRGAPALDFIPAQQRPAMAKLIARAFEEGQVSAEGELVAKNGEHLPHLLSGVRLTFRSKTYLLAIALDIRDRKQLEEQLRQSQKMEALGQLAGGVAHDFNNLLTVILGFAGMMVDEMPTGVLQRAGATAIVDAANQGARLTRQLLTFSRKAVVEVQLLDLNAVVTEAETLLRRTVGEEVTLTTTLAPNLRAVKVDPGLLRQVIMNLAVNARDAMTGGGQVAIETSGVTLGDDYAATHPDVPAGDYVLLAVTDNGSGMAPQVRVRMFEPFFTTKPIGRGTGLGLAVVHGVARQCGAHIEVDSEPGIGTSFRIYFPAAAESAAAVQSPESRTAGSLSGTETILLVEDEIEVRRLVRTVLERYGYTALEAENGVDAVRIAETYPNPIAMVITDVVMPGMNGREVAERVQQRWPGVRVLYMSGYTDDVVVNRGIQHHEVAFLEKPFAPDTLAIKVRAVLDEP
jgi:PAS domain S-box-containing protein